ncbi:MAG: cobyric acid synthase [Candidatus Latescibacteria bacterium]|nr:cobyric acid synthase [Candidatus Latescibacterota bacterium]
MAKSIMLQGTGSDVGKSVLAAALCRIFLQDGYRVAPFKSQNMALNSYVTLDGGEMGRAQVVQAQACRLEPDVTMNPILLKPTTDVGAQVIVMGRPVGNMSVEAYFRFKEEGAIPIVTEAYKRLAEEYDLIVIEGAGSPAEINLRDGDIVNMRMAEIADAPVILVGDIDRGGVFASLAGTMLLLEQHERRRIKAFLINKFRGRKALLDSGLEMIEARVHRPFLGVIPYFTDIRIPDEDSVAMKGRPSDVAFSADTVNIEVLILPHISNFTDFDPFEGEPDVRLRYLGPSDAISNPDVLFVPGSKNTIGDLNALQSRGIARKVIELAKRGATVVGICGGYQMLGNRIVDPRGSESPLGAVEGLGLLDVETIFEPGKTTLQVAATEIASGLNVSGYEIHMGETKRLGTTVPMFRIHSRGGIEDGAQNAQGSIWGTYLHGLFDDDRFRRAFIDRLRIRKGLKPLGSVQFRFDQDAEFDKLADRVRAHVDMERLYRIVGV